MLQIETIKKVSDFTWMPGGIVKDSKGVPAIVHYSGRRRRSNRDREQLLHSSLKIYHPFCPEVFCLVNSINLCGRLKRIFTRGRLNSYAKLKTFSSAQKL